MILLHGDETTAAILYSVLGMALAIFGTVIWPCIPLTVEKRMVGTGFGLTTALQNAGMAVTPILLTWLHSSSNSFVPPLMYLCVCCALGLLSGIALKLLDRDGSL